LAYQADMVYTPSDKLPLDRVLEFLTARLVGKDAKFEGRIFSVLSTGWPIYELREVEKKRSFDLVLIWGGLGADGLWRS